MKKIITVLMAALILCSSYFTALAADTWTNINNYAQPEKSTDAFYAIVEIPAGSNVKYELDETGYIIADRFMSMSVKYPTNYGSIASTKGADGDPLDVLIYTREPMTPGSLILCRPIGYLKMTDGGEADEKIIAVPDSSVDPTYDNIKDINDLPSIERERIKEFFATYKLLPEGSKKVVLNGFAGANEAKKLLKSAFAAYKPVSGKWVNLNNYPQPSDAPDEINVAIEIPQGSFTKYELDEMGNIIANRFQSTPVEYPANYGSIVSSKGGDGDPLDALVITRTPLNPGTIITCRPIGYLKMVDGGEVDEKVIAVPISDVDPTYDNIKTLSDLALIEVQQIEKFFANYKNLPAGSKVVELNGFEQADAAKKLVKTAINAFVPYTSEYVILNDYPQSSKAPDELTAVVEIPQGSFTKYELTEDGKIDANRFQSMPVVYPANYGSLSQTKGEDGDPLDVIIYTREPLVPGCIITVRPIGTLRMIDGGSADEKVIAVPISKVDPTYDDIKSISDLPLIEQQRLEQFFRVYKNIPSRKSVEVNGFEGLNITKKIVTEAIARFTDSPVTTSKVLTTVPSYAKNGNTMVPLKKAAEALGIKVTRHNDNVTIKAKGKSVSLVIGEANGTSNGEAIVLDTSPELINNTTYVPLSFLIEEFGIYTSWNERDKTVNILQK
ncbi:MAG TPA: inorganic diphosphatase [Mobilitalea sp.]|nr:inorganic diphosphatase [Mobilitalea sp.]